jgi:hypothetical protein
MASLPDVRFGVIDDARRRQRRRRLGTGAVALMAAIVTTLVLYRPGDGRHVPPAARPIPPVKVVAPGKVFSQSPYMGVTCRVPNSTACDDLGLAVWLKRPAVAVNAEMRGRVFSLDDRQWSGPVRHHRRTMFAGFLRAARLRPTFHLPPRWEGQPARNPLVRMRIDYGRGAVVEARLRVSLSPGWG